MIRGFSLSRCKQSAPRTCATFLCGRFRLGLVSSQFRMVSAKLGSVQAKVELASSKVVLDLTLTLSKHFSWSKLLLRFATKHELGLAMFELASATFGLGPKIGAA